MSCQNISLDMVAYIFCQKHKLRDNFSVVFPINQQMKEREKTCTHFSCRSEQHLIAGTVDPFYRKQELHSKQFPVWDFLGY